MTKYTVTYIRRTYYSLEVQAQSKDDALAASDKLLTKEPAYYISGEDGLEPYSIEYQEPNGPQSCDMF